MTDAQAKKRIRARKFEGDDLYSWAVFVDGHPGFTGLGKSEVAYYKKLARRIKEEEEG